MATGLHITLPEDDRFVDEVCAEGEASEVRTTPQVLASGASKNMSCFADLAGKPDVADEDVSAGKLPVTPKSEGSDMGVLTAGFRTPRKGATLVPSEAKRIKASLFKPSQTIAN